MPKKYHLRTKPALPRFVAPGPYGIIEADGCLNCANCVKKSCVYEVFQKRRYDSRQLMDTADSLCKNCFRCVQGCYGRILHKSRNPEFWDLGDDYWTPEIIASSRNQAETGKIPVSGAGYNGPFAGPGFDSMWTDMSEIVRPTRDGIHGREYISTSVTLGRILPEEDLGHAKPEGMETLPRIEVSIPMIFDLVPFARFSAPARMAMALAARETRTFMIVEAQDIDEKLVSLSASLIPLLPPGPLEYYFPAIAGARMVELSFAEGVKEKIREVKKVNPGALVSLRLPLTPQSEEQVERLGISEAEVIHFVASGDGKEQGTLSPRFIKDRIRQIHLHLVKANQRDRVSLVFGGGIAMAEHVAKAVICGADAVSIERPLLLALECRLCRRCTQGMTCPAELERIKPDWGRQRIVNLVAAWHGQLLEVLGAMGLRDLRRLRGEVGRAIFQEDIEKETFGRIFGEPLAEYGQEKAYVLTS